jgi:hypothetical protein
MTSGSLAGFPVVDIVATLFDGSYHEVDSSALAFQVGARARGASRRARPGRPSPPYGRFSRMNRLARAACCRLAENTRPLPISPRVRGLPPKP